MIELKFSWRVLVDEGVVAEDRRALVGILDELMSDLELEDTTTHGVSHFAGPKLGEFMDALSDWMNSLEMLQDKSYPLCKHCNEDKEWAWGLVDDEAFRSHQPESWLALHGDSLRQHKISFMQQWGWDIDGHIKCGESLCTCGCKEYKAPMTMGLGY